MAFKVGDVVKLKSGGPTMTVQNIGNYSNHGFTDGVLCVWFDLKGKNEALFRAEMLEAYSSPSRSEYAKTD